MTHSNCCRSGSKPAKPSPDFPLYPHRSGKWAKKCRGKTFYFGTWQDPDGALDEWLAVKDHLLAGRTPPTKTDGVEIRDILNRFLSSKRELVRQGELSARTFAQYLATGEIMVSVLGRSRPVDDLRAEDFEKLRKVMAERNGAARLTNLIQQVRTVFKYAVESGWLEHLPRFGPGFRKPSRKTLRTERARNGANMLEAEQIRRLIDAAGTQLRGMILLGCNCGLGNSDCGRLRNHHLDLGKAWLSFARPKTGVPRECPLWAETVEALRAAIAERPEPRDKSHADLVFVSRRGLPWTRTGTLTEDGKVKPSRDAVCETFGRLLTKLGMKKPGIAFYTLRRVFQTIGSQTRDETAVSSIMGHSDESMSARYRQGIDDDRLLAVTEHVRGWLFGAEGGNTDETAR